jgi:hypothetical protein
MMKRFSSRTHPSLGRTFLAERLQGAKSYDRIAGYFSSSILEVAGESIESIAGPVRVICNSELQPGDVQSARAAKIAMRQEWCRQSPEETAPQGLPRFAKLAELLRSGKLEVRVLPNHAFGLIHGKAGVITQTDGSATSFLGSANESKTAWEMNYELVWEDDSPEAIAWVREEFAALWNRHEAFPLAEAVIEDVERISRRKVYGSLDDWKDDEAEPASAIVETPVYRQQYGLWAHQKYFAKLAYDAHTGPFGARYVLADMVGLGKTIQLAMAALLMAIWGKKPILIIAPKPLLWQWQDEMDKLLARVIIKTEGVRDQETPAAEIARGLFNESTTAERTTTQEISSSSGRQDDDSHLDDEGETSNNSSPLFTGTEDVDGDI